MPHAALLTMDHAVLHNEAAETNTTPINDTPPSFPFLAETHRTSKLPRHREDTEDQPQYVSCQGM